MVEWVEAGAEVAPPAKLAVRGERGGLTWEELVCGAHSLSAFLREAGIGRGDRVLVWMDKSPACVQVLLGILGAGAAYVPLDPGDPPARAAAVARDCGAAALIADGPRRPGLPAVLRAGGVSLAVLDGLELESWETARTGRSRLALLADALAFPPSEPARSAADDLACLLYASDSTGQPRGAAHTHASALSLARWVRDRFELRSDDVATSHAPLHSDLSISDLFASLGAGASVRLLSPAETALPLYLVRMLDSWGVTVWSSDSSALVDLLERGGLEARPPAGLRLVLFAGEDLPVEPLWRLRRALPYATVASLLGPDRTDAPAAEVGAQQE